MEMVDRGTIVLSLLLLLLLLILLACNLPFTLRCIAPQCNYLHVHCAVCVIGLTAADSAHK
jgi:hypothetical protein